MFSPEAESAAVVVGLASIDGEKSSALHPSLPISVPTASCEAMLASAKSSTTCHELIRPLVTIGPSHEVGRERNAFSGRLLAQPKT